MKFDTALTKLVDPQDLDIYIQIISFKNIISDSDDEDEIIVNGWDFINDNNLVDLIFKKLGISWAERFNIDNGVLHNDEAHLLRALFDDNKQLNSQTLLGMIYFLLNKYFNYHLEIFQM